MKTFRANLMTPPTVPDEKDAGRLRQFLRLLMSHSDFKHAKQIATHLLELDWDAENVRDVGLLWKH